MKLRVVLSLMIALMASLALAQHKHGPDEKHKLGKKPIGDVTVSVIVIGEVEAGKPVQFDIKLYDVKAEPKAIRVWIGTEDGKGSTKAEGKKETTTYKGKVDVPSSIPQGAMLWVELETAEGTKSNSWDFSEKGHKH